MKHALRYCGNGKVSTCAKALWYSPLPLTTMQCTNRPSGIHQVLEPAP